MTAWNLESERPWTRSWLTLLLLFAFLVAIGSPAWAPRTPAPSQVEAHAEGSSQPRYAARGAGDGAHTRHP